MSLALARCCVRQRVLPASVSKALDQSRKTWPAVGPLHSLGQVATFARDSKENWRLHCKLNPEPPPDYVHRWVDSPKRIFQKIEHQLYTKEMRRLRRGKEFFDRFAVGDAIMIKMWENRTMGRTHVHKGVVIAKYNKRLDSSVLLRDVVLDIPVEVLVPIYSPLIKDVQVLQKKFIHAGKREGKRVRRAKLYYLRDKPLGKSTVTG